jgi:uncharacterized protein YndB with AHSA1/START domain
MNARLAPVANRFELSIAESLNHSPDDVWRAITEASLISQWMPVQILEMDLRQGGIGSILNPDGTTGLSEVIEFEPMTAFGFRAYANGQSRGDHDNLVRFLLEPTETATKLTIVQTIDQRLISPMVACGWEACLAALKALLAGESYQMVAPSIEGFERYTTELGLDQPAIEPIPGGWQIRFERQTLQQPLAKAWGVMTGGLSLREGDFAPPLFTGGNESGRIATLHNPGELEYLTADGGRVRWRLHEHFGSTRFNLTVAIPRTIEAESAATAWHDHLEALVDRIIAAD